MTNESLRRRAGIVGAAALLLAGCTVAPTEPAPAPSTSASPFTPSPDPIAGIAPYPGWTELARLHREDALDAATATGARNESSRVLLISTVCTGTGNVTIAVPSPDGPGDSTVQCPTPAEPQRSMPYLADTQSDWEVRVEPSGPVTFEVLVEGSDVPLHIPPIVLAADGQQIEMQGGCWSIGLSWGYSAGDSCGTTIPGQPIESIEMDRGAAATITIDGWIVSRADALCGRLKRAPGNPDLFEAKPDCTVQATLDGGAVQLEGLKPSAEPWLVELTLAAEAAWGDGFSGPFYAYVSVR